jgi:nitric oxide synthase oxygenase domain/subunit
MKSIQDFSDKELYEQIKNTRNDLDEAEYGTSDYNSALIELNVAIRESQQREALKGADNEELEDEYER